MKRRTVTAEDTADETEALRKEAEPAHAERALWCAVIERAVRDARGQVETTRTTRAEREMNRADAKAWLRSDSIEVGSVRWILGVTNVGTTQREILLSINRPSTALCG